MVYLCAADPRLAACRVKKIVVALAHPAVGGIKKEKHTRSIILALRIAPPNGPRFPAALRVEGPPCTASRPAAHPAGLRRDEVNRVQADVLGIVHRLPDAFEPGLSLRGRGALPGRRRVSRVSSLRRQRENQRQESTE